ncbi:MAG: maleylpyruvate isomerase N-terminal domain-containing protein, partial [Pseudonocardiaceae bacterium]
MSRPDTALAWVADGQALVERTVGKLDDLRGPSRLPGWSRGHVVTHIARNADGLCRLLAWARTGVATPMYVSEAARDTDIEAGAGRARGEQLEDLRRSGAAFTAAAQELTSEQWKATVATRHGEVPATFIPWARTRELWLHLVDLDAGAGVEVIPEDVASALIRDVAEQMTSRVSTRIELALPDGARVT